MAVVMKKVQCLILYELLTFGILCFFANTMAFMVAGSHGLDDDLRMRLGRDDQRHRPDRWLEHQINRAIFLLGGSLRSACSSRDARLDGITRFFSLWVG